MNNIIHRFFSLGLLFIASLSFAAGTTPINNAILQNDLDGGGQSITNVVIPDYVSTNDPHYLAAITNIPENIATLDDVTNIVDSALEPYALTNHQHDASDITGSTWITDADTNGWETGSHADFVTDSDTNGWNTAAFEAWVLQSDTNGWEVGSHADFVTDADTNGWEVGSHADFVTDALENLGGDTNAWHDDEYLRKDGDWTNPLSGFMSTDQARALLQTIGKTMELVVTSTNGAPCAGTYTWNVTDPVRFDISSVGYWSGNGVTTGPYVFYALPGTNQWNSWKIFPFEEEDRGTYWIGQELDGVETTPSGTGRRYIGQGTGAGTDVQVTLRILPDINSATTGGGLAGNLVDVAYTNDMSTALTITNTYETAAAIAKLLMRADTTNRPFSKTVIVDIYAGDSSDEGNRISTGSYTFEAVNLQTNATAGEMEIDIVQVQQIYDGDLVYLESEDGVTNEYIRVSLSVDDGSWTISYDGAQEVIRALCVYDGKLYAGQGSGTGDGDVLVYDGTTWTISYDGAQEVIFSLCVYDGKLYAGQGLGTGDGDVLRHVSTGLATLTTPLKYDYISGATMWRVPEINGWIGSTNTTLKLRTVSETSDYDVITIFKEVQ